MIAIAIAGIATGAVMTFVGLTSPPPRGPGRIEAGLEGKLRDAGLQISTGHAITIVGVSAIGAGLLALVVTALVPAGVGAALLVLGTANARLIKRIRARRDAFRDAWPDAIALIASGVRAGMSLPEVVSSLGDRGPAPLKPAFAGFSSALRASSSFQASLDRLARELADPIADRVCAALSLAYEVGGSHLVLVLRTLERQVRADARVRKEVEARWSWTRSAARVAAIAPAAVLGLMLMRPEGATAYGSLEGLLVIGCGGVATIAGYRLMLRAARLPGERRLER